MNYARGVGHATVTMALTRPLFTLGTDTQGEIMTIMFLYVYTNVQGGPVDTPLKVHL